MTSAIIKHRCVEQAYARSPWSKVKNQKDDKFDVIVEKEDIGQSFYQKKLKLVKNDRNMSFCEIRVTEDDLPSMFKREGYSFKLLEPFKSF